VLLSPPPLSFPHKTKSNSKNENPLISFLFYHSPYHLDLMDNARRLDTAWTGSPRAPKVQIVSVSIKATIELHMETEACTPGAQSSDGFTLGLQQAAMP